MLFNCFAFPHDNLLIIKFSWCFLLIFLSLGSGSQRKTNISNGSCFTFYLCDCDWFPSGLVSRALKNLLLVA